MAGRNQNDTMREMASASEFFRSVDPRGYPTVQEKTRPWKRLLPSNEGKKGPVEGSEKMVVVCSLLHDYGKHSLHCLRGWVTNTMILTKDRQWQSRRLLDHKSSLRQHSNRRSKPQPRHLSIPIRFSPH